MKRFHLTLRSKLSIVLFIAAVLPFIASTLLVTNHYDKALEKTMQEVQLTLAKSAASSIDRWLSMKVAALRDLVNHNEEIFLSGDLNRIMPLLGTVHYADSDVLFYGYTDLHGMNYRSDGVNSDLQDYDKEHPFPRELTITDIIEHEGRKTVDISLPLMDRSGQFAGLVTVHVNAQVLHADIEALQIHEAGAAYLLSPEGMILTHHKENLTGQSIGQYTSEETMRVLEDTVLKEPIGSTTYTNLGGIDITASYAVVNQTGWRAVISTPEADLLSAAREAKLTAHWLTKLFAVIMILIAILLSRVLVKPVLVLTERMRRAAGGDLSGRLEVRSKDEIGMLTSNINEMLDSFQTMISDLEKSTRSEQELLIRTVMMDSASKFDSLTGLYNHKSYHEYMDKLMEQTNLHEYHMTLAALDIDNFKKVNDTFGHGAGDIALKVTAACIRDQLDTNDFAARYGGEEFVILLTSKSHDQNIQILETIRQTIAESPIEALDGSAITISIGVHHLQEGDTKEQVFSLADQALYEAKRTGKNKVVTS